MKKIMFSDEFQLTKAVLERRKTMTRRIVNLNRVHTIIPGRIAECYLKYAPYKVGEVVAVAQSYKDLVLGKHEDREIDLEIMRETPGWNNKMFVRADLMPHMIRITDVRVERLQDISEEDVYKEGFEKETVNNGWGNYAHHWEAMLVYYDSLGRSREIRSRHPREAFATLIDKVSGYGTWESNPRVYVYEFELLK